jgi:hypothetical protein
MGDSVTMDNFPVEDDLSSIPKLLNTALNSKKVDNECRDRQNLISNILERLEENKETFQIDYSK